MFSTDTYRGRRAALRRELAARGLTSGTVLFPGAEEAPRNYADNGYRFRQDSSFLYFAGLELPGLALALDLDGGEDRLYADEPSMDMIVWTGPRPSVAELAALAGLGNPRPRAALAADLAASAAPLHYVPPHRAETRAELAALTGRAWAEVDRGASTELLRAAIALREIKSPEEVAEIEGAVATSVAMHEAAISAARPGMREIEIVALVTRIAIAGGGDLAFPVIATTRGAVLHNHSYGNVLREGGLFLLDAGAESASGYAGDLSSTFPIGRRFDARQREVHSLVVAAREAACAAVRPGRPYAEAHDAALLVLAEGLRALGLLSGDPAEAVATDAVALFMPHGVGHMMGLDVHDMENYGEDLVGYGELPRSARFGRKSLRLAKPLKAGMVHTVEPGCYLIPELVARWRAEGRFAGLIDYRALESWLDFGGVRDEVDWLVTPDGGRRLGPEFDKSPAAIEARRG